MISYTLHYFFFKDIYVAYATVYVCVHVIAYLVKQCWIHLNVLSSAQKQLQFQFGKFFTPTP